jgi:hypothetical protein
LSKLILSVQTPSVNNQGYLVGSSLDSLFLASIGASLEEFAVDFRDIINAKLKNLA